MQRTFNLKFKCKDTKSFQYENNFLYINSQYENMEIDKKQILNRFKEVKKITSDIDLAQYLGISRGTLSNWKARNSLDFELLFSKCEQESLHWLITGDGEMFAKNQKTAINSNQNSSESIVSTLLQRNEYLARENGRLQAENNELKKELARTTISPSVSAKAVNE